MGGSGTPFLGDFKPDELAEKIREEEIKAENQSYNTELNKDFADLLIDFNNRDVKEIGNSIQMIRKTLEEEIEGTLDIRYGGSVAKSTYIEGLSDIDTLVLLNNSSLNGKAPEQVKNYFLEVLQNKFPDANVSKGNLAVTIKLNNGHEIQMLPALRSGKGYQIQAYKKNSWTNIRPQIFTKSLRAMNIKLGGKFIPAVKLIKYIVSKLPSKRQMTGYHVEASAIEAFKNYTGGRTYKELLKHYFDKAANIVLSPIKDKSGQSTHVDDYTGKKKSIERKLISDSLSNIARRMRNADATSHSIFWKELFDLA